MTPEKRKARQRQRVWLWVTAAATALMLLILVGGTVRYAQQADRANRELERQVVLNLRIRQMQGILIGLGNAESSQRGYLLTGKPSYLTVYTQAVRALPELLDGLSSETSIPGLEGHLKTINELTREKLAELAETIRLHDADRRGEALALVNTDKGQDYMDRAREELNSAMSEIRKDRDKQRRG